MVDPKFPDAAIAETIVSELVAWMNDVARTTKAMRVYADNNEMLIRFVNDTHAGLSRILESVPEVTLSVRDDRLLYGGSVVHQNSDRADGLPFTFYRNAFRRITFVRGMTREELARFTRAIMVEQTGYDRSGEDLVSSLWRLALPHLRYLTIDAMAVQARSAETDGERNDIDRIQVDIEDIVSSIYRDDVEGDDVVKGVSISREDLEALKEIRGEMAEDLDLVDHVTARAIAEVDPSSIERLIATLERDTHDNLVGRLIDILVELLSVGKSAREAMPVLELFQQLVDSLMLSRSYLQATALLHRLRSLASESSDLQRLHIARQLLALLASDARVQPALETLNDGAATTSVGDVLRFLRALGPGIVSYLVAGLGTLESPVHRRIVCDLIVECGVPNIAELEKHIDDARWFVVRDVLTLAQHHSAAAIAHLVGRALEHPHPKVRECAVGMLRTFEPGVADHYLAMRLRDVDADVRLVAIRTAAIRKSSEAAKVMAELLAEDAILDRSARELRMLTAAYAMIAGRDAVRLLDKLLNPGFFAQLRCTDAQIGAAFALASIGTDAAITSLQRGGRTLNAKVREACRRALAREPGATRDNPLDAATSNIGTPTPLRSEAVPNVEELSDVATVRIPREMKPRVPPAATTVTEALPATTPKGGVSSTAVPSDPHLMSLVERLPVREREILRSATKEDEAVTTSLSSFDAEPTETLSADFLFEDLDDDEGQEAP